MKLALNIDGKSIEAEFTLAGGIARLSFDGVTHEAELSEPEPGLFVIIINGKVHRCSLERLPAGETEASVNGRRYKVSAFDRKRFGDKGGISGTGGGQARLMAPMPGKVVRVLLGKDAEVAANQGVVIVEAMKMQNEVQSPKAGKVVEIKVTEGQTVNAGEVLAVVE